MRKVLALPLIAVALLIPAGLATAALDDVKGPACADIIDSDWSYSQDGTTATVILFVASASCPSISYTLFAQDSPTVTTIVGSGTVRGDGTADDTSGTGTDSVTVTAINIPSTGQPSDDVCLYATTSAGRHVFDRAKDATLSPNCFPLIPGGTAGGAGFG